jgi:glycosyltransferase involved in cell wall biosynthesis
MISFVIPVYNEEKIITKSLSTFISFLKSKKIQKYEIILINDGSTDNTKKIIETFKEKHKKIKLISYKKNKGRGFAIKQSINHVNFENIIFIDMDIPVTTNLNIINQMIVKLKKNHIVIGSRFLQKSKIERRPLRSLISVIYRKIFFKICFPKIQLSDIDVGIKGFQKKTFYKLNKKTKNNRWSWDSEIILRAVKLNLKIIEIPIIWKETKHSNLNISSASIDQFFGLLKIKKMLKM